MSLSFACYKMTAAEEAELDRLIAAPYPLGKRERMRLRRLLAQHKKGKGTSE